MSSRSIKGQIEDELSVIVGKRIRLLSRAALMLNVKFGDDVEFKYLSGPKRGEVIMEPQFALHVHSSWRLLKDGEICLGQSDLFNRELAGFKSYESDEETTANVEFTRISEKVNEIFKSETVRVTRIEATELGDLKVHMEHGYCVEVFVDSAGDTESWRFYRNDSDVAHFVVFD